MSEPAVTLRDDIRHDWTVEDIRAIHDAPLMDLVFRAATIHRRYNDPADIQRASLLSIKTGGCPEDCAYCPQSAHHKEAGVERERLMKPEAVLAEAAAAKAAGAHRFCMGAAWRQPKDGPEFDAVLTMVRGVRAMGMEACVTLGMLSPSQAGRLAEAGLTAYNHNLDTGPDFYGDIISTRTYDDRLRTLENVRAAGIGVCCGGIVGMGEETTDRAAMLQVLANHAPHPESVPINALVAVPGTPLAAQPAVVVQRQVAARAAGVLFSTFPEYPQEVAIHAVAGLGEGLVNGQRVPEEYYLAKRDG